MRAAALRREEPEASAREATLAPEEIRAREENPAPEATLAREVTLAREAIPAREATPAREAIPAPEAILAREENPAREATLAREGVELAARGRIQKAPPRASPFRRARFWRSPVPRALGDSHRAAAAETCVT